MIHNRNTLLLSVAAASLLWPAGALIAATKSCRMWPVRSRL